MSEHFSPYLPLAHSRDQMQRAGHTTTSGLVNEMLELCALAGNPRAAERVVELATKGKIYLCWNG
jgi:hypothetical protein